MSTENPFATPSDAADGASAAGSLLPASQGKRFLTFIVDQIAIAAISFVLGLGVGIIGVMVMGNAEGQITQQQLVTINLIGSLVGWIALFLYYLIFEAACGKTIGKMVCGTKVVDVSGGQPSFGQILGRSACRFIPFEPFSMLKQNPVGWHDSIPKTLVVQS